jgi:hypothetical protein
MGNMIPPGMIPVNPNAMQDVTRLLELFPMPKDGTVVTVAGVGFRGDLFVEDGEWHVTTNFGVQLKKVE